MSSRARDVVRTARGSVAVMTSAAYSDDEKEARVRRAAGRLVAAFLLIAFWSVLAIAIPVSIVVAGGIAGLYRLDQAAEIASSWAFILAAGAAMTIAWVALSR